MVLGVIPVWSSGRTHFPFFQYIEGIIFISNVISNLSYIFWLSSCSYIFSYPYLWVTWLQYYLLFGGFIVPHFPFISNYITKKQLHCLSLFQCFPQWSINSSLVFIQISLSILALNIFSGVHLYLTCSSPRRAVHSHSLVCSKNSLLIVGIGTILNKELELISDLISLIVRAFIVTYQDYTINYIYINVKKSVLFFVY